MDGARNGARNMGRSSVQVLLAYLTAIFPVASIADESPIGPYVYFADIVEVYDGDTVTADIDLGFHTWRRDEKLRLYGIDAPEVTGENKRAGFDSRDWLRSQERDKRIIINAIKYNGNIRGKFGRYLANLFIKADGACLSVNDELVRRGLAVYREC